MTSLDDDNIFDQYYQANYDFNTGSLTDQEIDDIKNLAKEKRVNYALAPIGEKIFDFISEQSPNIHFELVELDNVNIDGMLYIPKSGYDKAYIILNGKKPFINQIFAAAHEYYHYIKDYENIKDKPYICCLASLKNINEKKASRFAAEFLLPEDALRSELKHFKNNLCFHEKKEVEYAYISMLLTLKYQLPLKAVIYRLHEEGYIKNLNTFIKNYDFIKGLLMQIKVFKDSIEHLYENKNCLVDNKSIIYQQIDVVYKNGLASREEIIKDAKQLGLDQDIVNSFFDVFDQGDEDDDDSDLMRIIQDKWGGEE